MLTDLIDLAVLEEAPFVSLTFCLDETEVSVHICQETKTTT